MKRLLATRLSNTRLLLGAGLGILLLSGYSASLAGEEFLSASQQSQIQQLQRKIEALEEARKEDIARQRYHIEQMISLKKSERSALSSEKYNHDAKSYARTDIERSIRALDSEISLLQSQRSGLR